MTNDVQNFAITILVILMATVHMAASVDTGDPSVKTIAQAIASKVPVTPKPERVRTDATVTSLEIDATH